MQHPETCDFGRSTLEILSGLLSHPITSSGALAYLFFSLPSQIYFFICLYDVLMISGREGQGEVSMVRVLSFGCLHGDPSQLINLQLNFIILKLQMASALEYVWLKPSGLILQLEIQVEPSCIGDLVSLLHFLFPFFRNPRSSCFVLCFLPPPSLQI